MRSGAGLDYGSSGVWFGQRGSWAFYLLVVVFLVTKPLRGRQSVGYRLHRRTQKINDSRKQNHFAEECVRHLNAYRVLKFLILSPM